MNFIYCPYCRKKLDVIEIKKKLNKRCKSCKLLFPFKWTQEGVKDDVNVAIGETGSGK